LRGVCNLSYKFAHQASFSNCRKLPKTAAYFISGSIDP
jgi:hypothetical protein